MSKHLNEHESAVIHLDALDDLGVVEQEDGPRNAALHARIAETAERFAATPHADLTPSTLAEAMDRVGKSYRVADAYRVVYASALSELNMADARTIDYAHRAAAQYTAALEQLTRAVSDARVALFDRLPVVPA